MNAEAVRENVTGFGVVLGVTRPERLVGWYRAALERLGARWEGRMPAVGESIIGFDARDDVAEKAAEPGRRLIDILVRDLRAAERHLGALRAAWVRPVEERGTGGWSARSPTRRQPPPVPPSLASRLTAAGLSVAEYRPRSDHRE